ETPGPVDSGFGRRGSGGEAMGPPGGGSGAGAVAGAPAGPMDGTCPSRNAPRVLLRPTAQSTTTRKPSAGMRRSRKLSKILPTESTPLRTVVLMTCSAFVAVASKRRSPTDRPVPLANLMSYAFLLIGSGRASIATPPRKSVPAPGGLISKFVDVKPAGFRNSRLTPLSIDIWPAAYQGSPISTSNSKLSPTERNTPGPPCVRGTSAIDVSVVPVNGPPVP